MPDDPRVLTLTQPWASLIALGEKRIETRSWSTPYRGAVLIHAAKGFPRAAIGRCIEEPFFSVLWKHKMGSGNLPLGRVVAVARIVNVMSAHCFQGIAENYACPPHEFEFGGYGQHGRWAWVLEDVVPVTGPELRGQLGLCRAPAEVREMFLPYIERSGKLPREVTHA